MEYINISDAKATLSALVEKVLSSGEDVVIGKMGKPMAKLIRYEREPKKKRTGIYKDQVKIIDESDEYPEDIARALGIID